MGTNGVCIVRNTATVFAEVFPDFKSHKDKGSNT